MGTGENVPSIRLAAVGVCLDRHSCEVVTQFMATTSGGVFAANVDRYAAAEREVLHQLEQGRVRVCFIDFDQSAQEALRLTERILQGSDVFVFAVSAVAQPDRIIAAMQAGCSEYLTKPLQSERVLDGIARVEGKQNQRLRSKVRGKVIAVLGAKGGTGATTLAVHLAVHLCDAGRHKCLLIDQHPALGDASLYLGTGRHQYSFYELASNTERLDRELIQGFLLHHECGLDLLDSPESVDRMQHVMASQIEHTLTFLAEMYEFVVIDAQPGLSEATLAAIAQSDQLAIVITAELAPIRNAVRYVEQLSQDGYPEANLRIVLNRCAKKSSLSDEQIEKALRRRIAVRIPNSYHEVVRAINAGVPVLPNQKSDFGAAIQSWAHSVRGDKAKAASIGGVLGILGR